MPGMCLAVVAVVGMSVVGGGGGTAMVSYRMWDIDLLYDISDAWTFKVNFMYEKFL
jgi:hypothetical protein